MDGRELLGLLLDLGHARHLSAEGTGLDAGPGGGSRVLGEHHHLSRLRLLGSYVGRGRPQVGADDPNLNFDLHRAAISHDVGGKDALNPGWLSERFPTEVRATAAGFVYHQGAVWGAAVAPTLTNFAVNQQMGFAKPMLYATVGSLIVYVIAVYLGPETKGKQLTADLEVFETQVG
jgi:hypothetical protein